jgi:hypothetical protein
MPKLEIELGRDLIDWLHGVAAAERLSVPEVIEVLIGLESGMRNRTRDGREYNMKATIYRGGHLMVAPRSEQSSISS